MDAPLSPIRSQKAYRTIVRTIVGLIARGSWNTATGFITSRS